MNILNTAQIAVTPAELGNSLWTTGTTRYLCTQLGLWLFIIFLLMAGRDSHAQAGFPSNGFTPEHDYSSSAIDSVDMDSGALILDIPIISYKQRGAVPNFTLVARYNPCNWVYTEDWQVLQSATNGWVINFPAGTDNQATNFPSWLFFGAGVQIVRGDALEYGVVQVPYQGNDGTQTYETQSYVQDGTGTQHLLYSQTSTSQARTLDGSGVGMVHSRGYSDGRGNLHTATFDFHGDGFLDTISDPSGANTITPVLSSSSTTQQSFPSVDHWIDSVGRNIPAPPTGYGFNPNPPAGCVTLNFPTSGDATAPYRFCYVGQTVSSDFGTPNTHEYGQGQTFLQSIRFPNGTSYTFSYDSWGELSQIDLPDGGTITYQWSTAGRLAFSTRTLRSRTVNPNVLTPGSGSLSTAATRTWTYCLYNPAFEAGCSQPSGSTLMTDPDGNDTLRYPSFTNPKTIQYSGSWTGGVVLKTVSTTLCNWPGIYNRFYAISEPHLVCEKDTTLSDGEMFAETTQYDTAQGFGDVIPNYNTDDTLLYSPGLASMGLPISQSVTSLGPTSPGAVLRTTTTHYMWQTTPSYSHANMLALPDSVTVKDGGGAMVAQTTFAYDETGSPQGTYGNLTSTGRWVGTNGAGAQTVTTRAAYNTQGMVTDTYDGNYTAGVSGRPGNHINITYDSTGLYPASITPSQTGLVSHVDYYSYDHNTGVLISHVDQNGNSSTDAAHMTTWGHDNMGRTTSVSYPDGGGSSYCYTDVGGVGCTSSSAPYSAVVTTNLAGNVTVTSSVNYDGLGEVVTTTAPSGAMSTTGYDHQGRVQFQSNPYTTRPSAYVSYMYDGLGRQLNVCNQDNGTSSTACGYGPSYRSTSYSGTTTVSKDEVENQGGSIALGYTRTTDSLGRLTYVQEPNAANTYYAYDVLGNLTCVVQNVSLGSQPTICPTSPSAAHTRAFIYDGLSRLVSSYNPEAGAMTYVYDANGNLTSKTDAHNLITNYYYDALSRMVQTIALIVNASGAISGKYLSTCYQYDTINGAPASVNLKGHLVAEWTQSGSNCASSYTPSMSITAKVFLSYDAMGRPLQSQQCVTTMCTSNPFNQTQAYDLAGNMTSWTDGRGYMTFTEQFDLAGRPTSLTNSISGNGLPSVLFSAQGYTAAGALQNWNVGGYMNFFRSYDTRLRVTSESVTH